MSAARTLVRGDRLGDRYRLDRPIARGGMASVWKGTDLALRRPVAVKVLHPHLANDPAVVARFRQEARTAARLHDHRLVAIYDIVTESGQLALVLEYVDGSTLREALDAGPLPIETAVHVVARVAEACHVAHEAGLVHRDIKPGNVLLTRRGPEGAHGDPSGGIDRSEDIEAVRITDFGIARAVEASAERLTASGTIVGTAKYLAPEQVRSEPVDRRTDVFALGVLLYECLTGTVPWLGDTDLAVATARLYVDPVPPRQLRPEIDPVLDAVVLRALARDPADRFATAAGLSAALLEPRSGTDLTPLPSPDPAVSGSRRRTGSPGPATDRRAQRQPGGRARSIRAVVASVVIVVSLASLVGRSGLLDGPDDGGTGRVGAPEPSSESLPPGPAARTLDLDRGRPLEVVAAAYDLYGDGDENDDLVAFAVDGITSDGRSWRTECYRSDFPDVGKPGVGLILSATGPADFVGFDLVTAQPGWTASLYVGTGTGDGLRKADLATWGRPVVELVGERPEIEVTFPVQAGRAVLLLFDSLAGVPPDDCFGERPGSRRIEVIEARPLVRT